MNLGDNFVAFHLNRTIEIRNSKISVSYNTYRRSQNICHINKYQTQSIKMLNGISCSKKTFEFRINEYDKALKGSEYKKYL